MLTQVADGVLTHQSELLLNNAVVVQGRAGALLMDPGITGSEMACLANDLRELGEPVDADRRRQNSLIRASRSRGGSRRRILQDASAAASAARRG